MEPYRLPALCPGGLHTFSCSTKSSVLLMAALRASRKRSRNVLYSRSVLALEKSKSAVSMTNLINKGIDWKVLQINRSFFLGVLKCWNETKRKIWKQNMALKLIERFTKKVPNPLAKKKGLKRWRFGLLFYTLRKKKLGKYVPNYLLSFELNFSDCWFISRTSTYTYIIHSDRVKRSWPLE